MQIYYFTRTGRSQAIAQGLGTQQGVTPRPITDQKSWSGSLGYLRAAIAGLRGKGVPVHYEKPTPGETVAVVFPIWAGGFPPAVCSFIKEVGRGNILAIPTSLGSTLKDRQGFAQVIDLVGKEITPPILSRK